MSALKGSIKLSDLFALSEEEREQEMGAMVESAFNPTEPELKEQTEALTQRITQFEQRYEMSSHTMRDRLAEGAIKETADICSWMLLIKALESFEPEPTKARAEQA
jgi:hypothetical protein